MTHKRMKAALESASSEQKEMYANHGRFAKTIEKVRLRGGLAGARARETASTGRASVAERP